MESAVKQVEEEAQVFSDQVLKEIEIFKAFKTQDFKKYLRNYTDTQIEAHQRGLNFWEAMIPIVNEIGKEI